jgi:ketosteroid isomerase-like protein
MSTSEIATVLAWHDALNAGDIDTLEAVSADDIEIGDAHGAAQGLPALRAWAQRFTGPVTVGDLYVRDGVVVAALTLPDGRTEASAFRVVHDHVTAVFRHPDLASALGATDLTEEDLDA